MTKTKRIYNLQKQLFRMYNLFDLQNEIIIKLEEQVMHQSKHLRKEVSKEVPVKQEESIVETVIAPKIAEVKEEPVIEEHVKVITREPAKIEVALEDLYVILSGLHNANAGDKERSIHMVKTLIVECEKHNN